MLYLVLAFWGSTVAFTLKWQIIYIHTIYVCNLMPQKWSNKRKKGANRRRTCWPCSFHIWLHKFPSDVSLSIYFILFTSTNMVNSCAHSLWWHLLRFLINEHSLNVAKNVLSVVYIYMIHIHILNYELTLYDFCLQIHISIYFPIKAIGFLLARA